MIIATLSPTVDPEKPRKTTAAHKSNIAIAIPMALASPYNPRDLTCCKNMLNRTEMVIKCIKQSD